MSTTTEPSEPNGTTPHIPETNGTTSNGPADSHNSGGDVEVIDLTGLSDSSSDEDEDHEMDDEGLEGEGYEDSGDESEIEIQLNAETRDQLHHALSTVSEPRLRHVLKRLVDTDQAVEIALTREFITIKRETQNVVPRWDRCIQCDCEFDVNTVREEDECAFHPGDLEVDEEGFADWDEDVHGEKDTPENRVQYPEEFQWSCCEKDGTSIGCVRGQHKPMEVTKKRKRSD